MGESPAGRRACGQCNVHPGRRGRLAGHAQGRRRGTTGGVPHPKASDGKLSGTFDSVDQGARGIPIEEITLADGKLRFSSAAVNGTYEGKLNPAASTIDGKWSQGQPSFPQGGNDIPLLLPVKDAAAIRCRRQPAV